MDSLLIFALVGALLWLARRSLADRRALAELREQVHHLERRFLVREHSFEAPPISAQTPAPPPEVTPTTTAQATGPQHVSGAIAPRS